MPNKRKGKSLKKKQEKFRAKHPEGRKAFAEAKRTARAKKLAQKHASKKV